MATAEFSKFAGILSPALSCWGPAPVDPGNLKVGTASVSLEITYLITDREGLED